MLSAWLRVSLPPPCGPYPRWQTAQPRVTALVDLVLAQVGGGGDSDLLLVAGAKILSGYMYYAVCIDIEADFDLRHAAGEREQYRPAGSWPRALIVLCHLALALKHMNFNAGLAVRRSGEYLALLGGDGGVAVDQAGEYAADGLDAQRQRALRREAERPLTSPPSTPPWIAAPIATHSSGFMPLKGSLPVMFLTSFLYCGNTG